MLGSSPHSLVGWDLGQGGAAGRTFAPGATDLRDATGSILCTDCVNISAVYCYPMSTEFIWLSDNIAD